MPKSTRPSSLIPAERVPWNERRGLSQEEVAMVYGIGLTSVKELAKAGKLKFGTLGRRKIYRPADVEAALFGDSNHQPEETP